MCVSNWVVWMCVCAQCVCVCVCVCVYVYTDANRPYPTLCFLSWNSQGSTSSSCPGTGTYCSSAGSARDAPTARRRTVRCQTRMRTVLITHTHTHTHTEHTHTSTQPN